MLVGWWKLDGNALDSSGNGHHGSTIGTLPIVDNGKIGKTFGFANNENGISVASTNLVGLEVYTMCAWVKPLGNHRNYNGTIISSGNWNSKAWAFGLSQNNSQIDVASYGYNRYISHPVPVGEWTHILCTAQNNITKVYVNGAYIGQVSTTSRLDSSASNLCIGRETYASGYFSFNGNINDVRVYDHILSEKEIKELAQAKILHYKFDDFQEPTRNMLIGGGEPVTSSSYAIKDYPLVEPLVEGRTYTVSMKATLGEGKSYFGLYNSGPHVSVTVLGGAQLGEDGVYRRTFTWQVGSSANTYLRVYHMPSSAVVDSTVEWIQVEEKDHPTPFVDDTRGGMVCDCSGYDNHGSLELATTPQWVSESKIGTGCYQFDGETSHILVNATTMDSLVANDFSITFWLNSNDVTGLTRDVLGGGNYGHTYGGVAFSHHSGNTWCYDIYTEPSGRHTLTISDSSNIIPFNQWSHIVLSRNRSNSSQSIHVNGVKVGERTVAGSEDIRWNQSAFPLKIGKGHYNSTNGMIDDVRIYTTALSDADIKDLYQTRASLDNVGNLCTHELQQPFNFLDPKLFYKYANSGDPNYEVVEGRNTWSVWPVRFYPNGALNGLFKENTQYRIRTVTKHDTNYNDVYKPGGFVLFYTDGTSTNVVTTGGTGEWLTTDVMSDAGKTIAKVGVYYYTNYRVMIDIDESYMVEYMPNSITDKGVLTFLNYSEVGPTHGLIGWWPLDGHAKDLSGEGKHGTVYGATVATGINGMAYSFDGIDDYIDCGVNFAITNQLTLGAWVKMNEYTTYPRICGVENKWILYISPTGQLCWYGSGADKAFLNSPNLLDGQWHHVMATYGGDGIDGYIDGTYIGTLVKTGDLTAIDTTSLTIGGRISGSRQLSGTICDVRIYNRTLSPEEIKILYSATKPNPVAMQLSNTGVVYIPGQLKEV